MGALNAERTNDRRGLYAQTFEALRYAQSCSVNGDGDGERIALGHAADLVASLLDPFRAEPAPDGAQDAGKVLTRSETGRMGKEASPFVKRSKALDAERKRAEARGGKPAEMPAETTVERIPTSYAAPLEEHAPEERGHVPKGTRPARKFRLFEANGDTWKPVAVGSATELANEYGVTASQVYALAAKQGSTSRDGRWRCEKVG